MELIEPTFYKHRYCVHYSNSHDDNLIGNCGGVYYFFSDRIMCGNDTRTIKQQEVKQILIKKRIKMRIHNLWKNVSALLVAGCICCTMPSCNNDEAPATMQVQH